MNEFISKHAVRIFAVLAAVVPFVAARFPGIPWEALVGLAATTLGVGEAAQRHEDSKTDAALNTQSPWDAAAAIQADLAELESKQAAPADDQADDGPGVETAPTASAATPQADAAPAERTPVPAAPQADAPAQS